MDNVERNALLGDKNAQESLSWLGVLLKCPCCEDTPDYWQSGNGGFVECTGCGLQMRDSTLEGAIELWNTRPAPPIVHGKIIETIENGKMKRVFSCCGKDFTTLTTWCIPNFCPNCGAKMSEEKDW